MIIIVVKMHLTNMLLLNKNKLLFRGYYSGDIPKINSQDLVGIRDVLSLIRKEIAALLS